LDRVDVVVPRGSALFDTWLWTHRLRTSLGDLPVELLVETDDEPTTERVTRAAALVNYVGTHDALVLDPIWGHYRYAESKHWLSFWSVPAGRRSF
jgi:hypothetical protein